MAYPSGFGLHWPFPDDGSQWKGGRHDDGTPCPHGISDEQANAARPPGGYTCLAGRAVTFGPEPPRQEAPAMNTRQPLPGKTRTRLIAAAIALLLLAAVLILTQVPSLLAHH